MRGSVIRSERLRGRCNKEELCSQGHPLCGLSKAGVFGVAFIGNAQITVTGETVPGTELPVGSRWPRT